MTDILNQLPQKKERKKKGSSQKNKGKVGERAFAELFGKHSGYPFIRIYTSGASVGRTNNLRLQQLTNGQGLSQLGDIMAPEYMKYQFVLESKNYADLDFHNLFINKNSSSIIKWYNEMMFDVHSAYQIMKTHKKVIGILCVKITRKGEFLVINNGMLREILGDFVLPAQYLSFLLLPKEELKNVGWDPQCYMVNANEFLKLNKNMFELEEKS